MAAAAASGAVNRARRKCPSERSRWGARLGSPAPLARRPAHPPAAPPAIPWRRDVWSRACAAIGRALPERLVPERPAAGPTVPAAAVERRQLAGFRPEACCSQARVLQQSPTAPHRSARADGGPAELPERTRSAPASRGPRQGHSALGVQACICNSPCNQKPRSARPAGLFGLYRCVQTSGAAASTWLCPPSRQRGGRSQRSCQSMTPRPWPPAHAPCRRVPGKARRRASGAGAARQPATAALSSGSGRACRDLPPAR